MQFVYTVGMGENQRIAADRLGKELGGLEKTNRPELGSFCLLQAMGELTSGWENLWKRGRLEPMGATGIEPMTSIVSR